MAGGAWQEEWSRLGGAGKKLQVSLDSWSAADVPELGEWLMRPDRQRDLNGALLRAAKGQCEDIEHSEGDLYGLDSTNFV